MCVVELLMAFGAFLCMTSVCGDDIALGVIFYKESFCDVSESIGRWLLGIFEYFL